MTTFSYVLMALFLAMGMFGLIGLVSQMADRDSRMGDPRPRSARTRKRALINLIALIAASIAGLVFVEVVNPAGFGLNLDASPTQVQEPTS